MVVAECGGGVAEAQWDCGNAMMGYASRQCGSGQLLGYVSRSLRSPSLSSRNTLGNTTHNSNKIGLSWGGGSVWWASLCESGGGG